MAQRDDGIFTAGPYALVVTGPAMVMVTRDGVKGAFYYNDHNTDDSGAVLVGADEAIRKQFRITEAKPFYVRVVEGSFKITFDPEG